ncbi:MAG: hypothetical protein ABI384_01460 [Allobranchiibius sp.]
MINQPTGSSPGRTVCSHAQLAERVTDAIWELHQARLTEVNVEAARAQLEDLLVRQLLPVLNTEDRALQSCGTDRHLVRRMKQRSERRHHRQLREHRRMIEAVHDVQRAHTSMLALNHAERVSALLTAHLIGEDRELAAAPESERDHGALTAELQELVHHDHARITQAMVAARLAATNRSEDELGSFDRVVSAVSHHAVVMTTRAYPMLRSADSELGPACTASMLSELRSIEHTIRALNNLLRGGAGGNPSVQRRLQLWSEIEQSWARHTTDEETLVHHAGAELGPQRAARLITLLRRPIGHSLTRAHPRLLGGGRPTRVAIIFQGRLDRARDEMDNRSTWS